MLRKLGRGALVLLLAAAALVVTARVLGAGLPGLPLPPLSASVTSSAQQVDSARAAALISRRCGLLLGHQRRECYEDSLLQMVRQGQIRLAISTLAVLGEQDSHIKKFGHDYSHVIGINAWTPGKDIGSTYAQCTELFQSGCYHGVIQAVLAYQGTDSARVVALCGQTPEINASAWLRFQCVHGLGHGLLQTYTMNLPRALHGCDMLGNAWDAESCYGGAFMEFIVGGRGQSHHVTVGTDSSKTANPDDHSTMDHGGGAPPGAADTFPPFKVREPGDPLYPCSVLADRYQRACYQMQAGLIVERTGLDFARVATVCEGAQPRMRPVCYQGIGTYVSGVTTREPAEAIRLCSMGSVRYRSWCFVGVVKNFIDVTARAEDGIAFCRRLGPEDIATACYVAVGEQSAVLHPSMDRREQLCVGVESKYQPACRYGSGLARERPPALPVP
jgi:hypothetical protein